ncbi:hypothetical protein P5673_020791 [Acropora cervicornis]|uniref:Uncharacterized protein n=1 Tax=Acropora cervicornis TaxID=6130 RepID=A0AAD9Q917_ACRCE|nr:hypothetical protein P5673_020791 [Acropora cervicornis]
MGRTLTIRETTQYEYGRYQPHRNKLNYACTSLYIILHQARIERDPQNCLRDNFWVIRKSCRWGYVSRNIANKLQKEMFADFIKEIVETSKQKPRTQPTELVKTIKQR